MSINLRFWDVLKTPPQSALKKITGGRLKGFSDIIPQWRYKAMTELFGPIGFGWKFKVTRTWTQAASDGQIMCFVDVEVQYKDGDSWSDPINATGGDFLVKQEGEKNDRYLRSNDEAYKMATTDAIGVALKYIGVAADVYMDHQATKYNQGEESKPYQQAPQKPAGAPPKALPPKGAPGALVPGSQVPPPQKAVKSPLDTDQKKKGCVINEQIRFIKELIKQKNITKEQFEAWLFRHAKIKNVWDIPSQDFEGICRFIQDDPGTILGTAAAGQSDIPPAGEDAPWEGNQ